MQQHWCILSGICKTGGTGSPELQLPDTFLLGKKNYTCRTYLQSPKIAGGKSVFLFRNRMLFIHKKCLRVNLCENTDLKEMSLVSCVWSRRGVVWLWRPLMSGPAAHDQELKSQYRPCAVPENAFWERTVCTSLSHRMLIPSADERTIARDFGTGTLLQCAVWGLWSGYEIREAGVDFVWPERKYSVSRASRVEQQKQSISFTTTQEHLLLPSSEIPHCPLMSLSHTGERWPCRLFCIFSRKALVLKVFFNGIAQTPDSSPLSRTWHPAWIKYSPWKTLKEEL